ncbi:MAG: thioredoxin family protein [Verrucomicrobia bacterium]|nr:thioredoxin family protein [Verrucomicrobiota bacterium]
MINLLVAGPGCGKCQELSEHAEQAARELGVPYELTKVTDLKEIMALRILMTPALVVNGSVKSTGKVLSVDQIKIILQDAA